MPPRKRTPIERIFRDVFKREMTSSEFEILLAKPIEARNSNGITPNHLITQAKTSVVSMNDEKTHRVNPSQVSRAVMGLREMLLRGEFQPGERIAEIPLSLKLGVSRTPLRLAFEKLANEGLIKEHHFSGFAASEFSVDDIWEAIETRSILEGAAARLAANRLKNPARLQRLRKINRTVENILKLDIEVFTDRYLDLNKAFHTAMIDLADNQVLRRAIERIWMLPFTSPSAIVILYKTVPASKAMIPIAQEHHRGIIEAIEHGDGERAYVLAYEHAYMTRRNLELAMGNSASLHAIPGASLLKFRNAGKP
jgi:GntR family transcriptional regulator of vanillate catabolism